MTATRRADGRWRTAVVAVGGLLVAIAVIGVAGILINRDIHQRVEEAITFDVELEDRGDDLRVAILEVRHYHRDLLLNNPTPIRVELWQERFETLRTEIDSLEAFIRRNDASAELPDVGALSVMAESYHEDFAAALQEVDDLDEFQRVADDLLVPLNDMAEIAEEVDAEGQRRAAASFVAIDQASTTGTLVLVAVILGLGAMGGVLGFAVLRLVEDQRRLVIAEQAAAARLAEASQAKTDFIADASHELRTPLTVLRGNAEVGLAMQDDCAHAEVLADIVDESARMSRLVDDLLFLARSDAAAVPLELHTAEAAELMTALAGRAEVLARERGAALAPTVECEGTLRVDVDRFEQAVLILVDNAAKYGADGGTVELDARTGNGVLAVEVRDRGPGIPEAQLARVFERFYRVERTGRGRSSGGTGLGLSIAAAIAEGHRGRISAAAREGGGMAMRIELPMGDAAPEASSS